VSRKRVPSHEVEDGSQHALVDEVDRVTVVECTHGPALDGQRLRSRHGTDVGRGVAHARDIELDLLRASAGRTTPSLSVATSSMVREVHPDTPAMTSAQASRSDR
jgi:hypothetical protein